MYKTVAEYIRCGLYTCSYAAPTPPHKNPETSAAFRGEQRLAPHSLYQGGLHHILYIKEVWTTFFIAKRFAPHSLSSFFYQGSSFDGFISFSTLLFRHLLEDDITLTSAIENTILAHYAGTATDENNDMHLKGNTMVSR